MSEYIHKYEPLWGTWNINELIRTSIFGDVYKISRVFDDGLEYSLLKVISLPTIEELDTAESITGTKDDEVLEEYFEKVINNMLCDMNRVYSLKGKRNVLVHEDISVERRKNDFGWDILVRSNHEKSLKEILSDKILDEKEIISIAKDLCNALILCEARGIIHREIRDDNIFIGSDGVYKLGNFGVQRELSDLGSILSDIECFLYIAPEVIRGKPFSFSSDIYSLGIVLFRLLNPEWSPFEELKTIDFEHEKIDMSSIMKVKAEKMKFSRKLSSDIDKIVLKACAYKENERYKNTFEMLEDLKKLSISNNLVMMNSIEILPQNENGIKSSQVQFRNDDYSIKGYLRANHLMQEDNIILINGINENKGNKEASDISKTDKINGIKKKKIVLTGIIASVLTVISGLIISTVYAEKSDLKKYDIDQQKEKSSVILEVSISPSSEEKISFEPTQIPSDFPIFQVNENSNALKIDVNNISNAPKTDNDGSMQEDKKIIEPTEIKTIATPTVIENEPLPTEKLKLSPTPTAIPTESVPITKGAKPTKIITPTD